MKKKHELIMLPSSKGNLYKVPNHKGLFIMTETETNNTTYTQHLYILSDDEIKERDWCYNSKLPSKIYQFGKGIADKESKKIIATTDSSLNLPLISSVDSKVFFSFIHYFISEYNKGNIITEVKVEYEEPIHLFSTPKLKINQDNTINISLVEEKLYTREQMLQYILNILKIVH